MSFLVPATEVMTEECKKGALTTGVTAIWGLVQGPVLFRSHIAV